MTLNAILVWVNIGLILALMGRVVALKFRGVFRLFLLVLAVEFLFLGLTAAMKVEGSWARYHLDYRIVFPVDAALELAITACIVFALLRSFMSNFPGILKLSNRVLSAVVLGALLIGTGLVAVQMRLDERPRGQPGAFIAQTDADQKEMQAAHMKPTPTARVNLLKRAMSLTEILDQAVSTVLLLTLLAMLAFLLWFPVDVPRNLVVFSAGYLIYFAVRSLSLFMQYFSPDWVPVISVAILVVSAGCCFYWLFFLSVAGETAKVRIGHSWKPQEQERLLVQLDAINATLLRSARRSQTL
jgi:hypothetical protein